VPVSFRFRPSPRRRSLLFLPYFSGIYGCVYLAVGDLDFDLLALRDASGRGHGTASGAQDGESQPEDAFGRTSGDQFRGVAEPFFGKVDEFAQGTSYENDISTYFKVCFTLSNFLAP